MSRFFNINNLSEILCLLSAVLFLHNETDKSWKWHPWYLALVVIFEMGGLYIRFEVKESNQWWYNLYMPVAALFITIFLYRQIVAIKSFPSIWLKVWIGVFCGVWIAETWASGLKIYNYTTSTFLDFSILCGCFTYYILLMRGPAIPLLIESAAFWWVFGVCNFHFARCVFDLNIPILNESPYQLWGMPLARLINYTLDIILYSTWIVSYYLRYKCRKQKPRFSFTL